MPSISNNPLNLCKRMASNFKHFSLHFFLFLFLSRLTNARWVRVRQPCHASNSFDSVSSGGRKRTAEFNISSTSVLFNYSVISEGYWRRLFQFWQIPSSVSARFFRYLDLHYPEVDYDDVQCFGMKFISARFCLHPTPCLIRARCWQRQFDWHVFLLGRLRRKPSDCFAVVNIQEISVFSKSLRRGRINMFCHHYANKNVSGAQRTKRNKKKKSNHCESSP